MSEPEIRPIADDELEPWVRAVESSFGGVFKQDYLDLERMVARPERYLAAFDGERIVGGNASIPVDLTVIGGARIDACGINAVGVTPGETRRGISTALMRRQLDDARERGEAVAILHASEAAIYGRYGFGIATRNASLHVDVTEGRFVRGYEARGRVRLTDRDEGLAAYVAARRAELDRPGCLGPIDRYADWFLRDMELNDDDVSDPKAEPPFVAVHETSGRVDGVAIYRIKHGWPDSTPRNKVILYDVAAATAEAYADLWRFVLDLDLVASVERWSVALDEPLFRLVREPRALRMKVRDGMFVAFVDLAAALTARRYTGSGTLRLRVHDAFSEANDGTWELEVDDGMASCRRTAAEPHVSLTATDLAATYLGDVTFAELASALRAEGDADAIARADALTASHRVPWSWLLV
ncbi:MAG TPA: GNAT family N-acetyltransferase [Actinomycetota bacterium]|nr:GNAT family N-acetyltransferase [Actinomycetota bacterium]